MCNSNSCLFLFAAGLECSKDEISDMLVILRAVKTA